MSNSTPHRLLRPETLTAIGLIVVAAAFLVPVFGFQPISALLPATMLVALMVLAALMAIADQRKAGAGDAAQPLTRAPRRVSGAFLLIVGYTLAVDFIGFYVSTAIIVPLVAFAFGYRNPRGLAAATAIVIAAIYLIFTLAMSQDFPVGRLWDL